MTDAITSWLGPPAVVGLNEVHAGPPYFADGGSWELDSQLGWGAIGFVWLASDRERRLSLPWQTGMKAVTYDATIELVFKYVIGPNEDQKTAATAYVRPLNNLLEGVKNRIREDPLFGTRPGNTNPVVTSAGLLLQAGQGDVDGGLDDITLDRDYPRRDSGGGVLWSWNVIHFNVVEVIRA